MINPMIEEMILKDPQKIFLPAENVTNVLIDNNLLHAVLVLTNVRYTLIPVLDNKSRFQGLISLKKIIDFLGEEFYTNPESLEKYTIKEALDDNHYIIEENFLLEEVLNALVDHTFLCIVDKNQVFKGIIPRSLILKRVNYLVHEIDKEYHLLEKDNVKLTVKN